MSRLRVHTMSMSVDGFVAGPSQSLENPLGVGGEGLHRWIFMTPTGRRMTGADGDTADDDPVDEHFVAAGFDNIGAWILGRNMFGPIRGKWGDSDWSGWWGDTPPYHCEVFVLTHHARTSLEMDGGTTFYFVDAPIADVRERAIEAAGGRDVRIGGGASTVRQFMAAGLVDDVHFAIVPVLLGGGERLFEPDTDPYPGYECVAYRPSKHVAHVQLAKRG